MSSIPSDTIQKYINRTLPEKYPEWNKVFFHLLDTLLNKSAIYDRDTDTGQLKELDSYTEGTSTALKMFYSLDPRVREYERFCIKDVLVASVRSKNIKVFKTLGNCLFGYGNFICQIVYGSSLSPVLGDTTDMDPLTYTDTGLFTDQSTELPAVLYTVYVNQEDMQASVELFEYASEIVSLFKPARTMVFFRPAALLQFWYNHYPESWYVWNTGIFDAPSRAEYNTLTGEEMLERFPLVAINETLAAATTELLPSEKGIRYKILANNSFFQGETFKISVYTLAWLDPSPSYEKLLNCIIDTDQIFITTINPNGDMYFVLDVNWDEWVEET